MSSMRSVHALLLVMTCLGFGVAAVVMVVKPRSQKDGIAAPSSGSVAPARPVSGAELERAAAAPAGNAPSPKAQRVVPAALVIPPALALKFEKQYRDLPPSSLELAHQKLKETLRVQAQKHASEESILALRREIAWLAERLPREEGR